MRQHFYPITISITCDEVMSEDSTDFGIIAEVTANTWFNLLDADNVETVYGEVEATYNQVLFLPLPLLRFPCRMAKDDGLAIRNQIDYIDLPIVVSHRRLQYTVSVLTRRKS